MKWWTRSWNPVIGCQHVSAGCLRCWAERMASRFAGPGQPFEGVAEHGHWTGRVQCLAERLTIPMHWHKPQSVFVADMGDLFHPAVPRDFLEQVYQVMERCPQHRFYLLTKRSGQMRDAAEWLHRGCSEEDIPDNIWWGVTVEDRDHAWRIDDLLRAPVPHRFVSLEPLLGPLELDALGDAYCRTDALRGFVHADGRDEPIPCPRLDWVIVGGESGPGARPCDVVWVRDVVRQCREAAVPCFCKQLGGVPMMRADSLEGRRVHDDPEVEWPEGTRFGTAPGYHTPEWGGRWAILRDRAGADPTEWPEDLRVREVP